MRPPSSSLPISKQPFNAYTCCLFNVCSSRNAAPCGSLSIPWSRATHCSVLQRKGKEICGDLSVFCLLRAMCSPRRGKGRQPISLPNTRPAQKGCRGHSEWRVSRSPGEEPALWKRASAIASAAVPAARQIQSWKYWKYPSEPSPPYWHPVLHTFATKM